MPYSCIVWSHHIGKKLTVSAVVNKQFTLSQAHSKGRFAQGSGPIPEGAQGQTGWSPEQPGLSESCLCSK